MSSFFLFVLDGFWKGVLLSNAAVLTNQSLIETHCNAYLATLLTKLAPLQHDVMLDRVPSGQSYFGHTSSTTKMGVREELILF